MKVSSVSEMRRLDKTATEKFGIQEEILMENAGEAASFVLLDRFGIKGKKFVVFCGSGNNGGDGFVVARKIHSNGGDVRVFLLGGKAKFRGAAKTNLDIIARLAIVIEPIESLEMVSLQTDHCDVIVDAIFGTGLTRPVTGFYHDVINLINTSARPVVSLDIPSGVAGDTGKIMGAAVKAEFTVTFGLPKTGNLLFPGCDQGGKLFVTHISFPPVLYDLVGPIKLQTNDLVELPPRNKTGHKGAFGDVLFIAGASSYFGAPYFAALSFLKAGGGYSRLAAPRSIVPFIAAKGSEIVFVPQSETVDGSVSLKNRAALLDLVEKVDMVVMGPGLSLHEETQTLVRDLAARIHKPLLLDGDGITALSKDPDIIRQRQAETILTPHPGEMSRLTSKGINEIEANRIEILKACSKELNSVIVLKGAPSLIGYPDESVFINLTGNCGMATAGSGDVLAGTIAAMRGLGLPVKDAVRNGVFIHGFAGDLATEKKGQDGLTAQDIMDFLPLAMKTVRDDKTGQLSQHYSGVTVI